jgi:glucosamine-6-phosphate deaminase
MQIRLFDSVADLTRDAAAAAAATLGNLLAVHENVRIIAATGSSQLDFLAGLVARRDLDWRRVELFHLDEYVGISPDHPASFARFIRDRIITPAGIERYHLIEGLADPMAAVAKVSRELARAPVHLAFAGIGENGHLAFNEPPARFVTDELFTTVDLDETSRRQQVGEGWFATLDEVPRRAITMTIPAIMRTGQIICIVHGARKAAAVSRCFNGPPGPDAPASILATHPAATIYMDRAAAARLDPRVTAGTA